MATGVARPKAQGQEITKTLIKIERENSKSPPFKYQYIAEVTAIKITQGTKIPEILSASFAIGALVALASSTSSIIFARLVSSPTSVASNFIKPVLFVVPA